MTAGKIVIVKVQLPLGGTAPPMALVYDKSRKQQFHLPISEEIKESMGGSFKKFFEAQITGKSVILGKEAAWQDW